jgi:hypothetical protein
MSEESKDISERSEVLLPDEAQELLTTLQEKGRRRAADLRQQQFDKSAPKILYHYTGDDGLHGILSSGSIWLTDLFALNDPSELRHDLSPVVEALEAKATGGLPQAKLIADIYKRAHATGVSQVWCHQVACLSFRGDDLGQWRSYGQSGRGYAIGFDAGELVAPFLTDGESWRQSFPIIYDDQLLAATQQALVEDHSS